MKANRWGTWLLSFCFHKRHMVVLNEELKNQQDVPCIEDDKSN